MSMVKYDLSLNTGWITQYVKALRLLSLTLALGGTTSGILAARRAGYIAFSGSDVVRAIPLIIVVTIAGLALQTGANLINDYFEGSFKYRQPGRPVRRRGMTQAAALRDQELRRYRFLGRERTAFDILVFTTGLGLMGLASVIGLYLVWLSGWGMLLIGLVGVLGCYAYTGEPFVYKRRGLGAVLSWVLMGPLMNLGAWYPFGGGWSWYPILIGLPLSFLVPALMVSNEMRDFRRDRRVAAGTLSTRIGPALTRLLYSALLAASFLSAIGLVLGRVLPTYYLAILLLLPMALRARSSVQSHAAAGIPWTNALHLAFFAMSTLVLLYEPGS